MRNIKKIHHAEYRPVGTLVTYSPLPSAEMPMMDPFIFLNHHGPSFLIRKMTDFLSDRIRTGE